MNGAPLASIFCRPDNLELVLDNLQEGIIAHDPERRIFFFNREAERITGYARAEVLGRDCHEAFGAPFCGGHCSFCERPASVPQIPDYTTTITTRNGESRRIEMRITCMQGPDGALGGVLACFRDVTDLLSLRMKAGEPVRCGDLIGRDHKMLSVFEQIRDVAAYDFPVHISGETGTGKELVAQAIHNESPRAGAPFVPINCGALPESLIESELFGHVKGAFSGAVRDRRGRFEIADGGTVFLDEVAELSPAMQVKLLRFLQEGRFERVGGEETVSVNVRILSATNRSLKKEVERRRFREDLFYRLNVIPIRLPPLRERKNDIPLLIDHFLREAAARYGREVPRLSHRALAVMLDYRWPGNVRELQNAVQFAFVQCEGRRIEPEHLPLELRQAAALCPRRGPQRKLAPEAVARALEQTGGNKAKAAKLLGVGRATLYRFLGEHPEFTA